MSTQETSWLRFPTNEHWYSDVLLRETPWWYRSLDYPHNEWAHTVSLNTQCLDYEIYDLAIPPNTWLSHMSIHLEAMKEEDHAAFMHCGVNAIDYLNCKHRCVRIGRWNRDDEWHKGNYRLYPGQTEAEEGHKKLVQYLELFMLERRLFDKDFSEMEAERQQYLDSAGIVVSGRES